MQIAPELGIPEIKPAIESIGGRWVQKVSPQSRHSVVQLALGSLLRTWSIGRGQVGTEWRCYFLPEGERWSSLVPDVAYFSYERLPRDLGEVREKPTVAPDIAVEIASPDDRRPVLDEKVDLYLRGGAQLVIVVDTEQRRVELHECGGRATFALEDVARSRAFSDLALDVSEVFVDLL